MIPAIDISRWQGAVNFAQMRDLGVTLVWCRVANGTTADPAFTAYVRAAHAAGLKVGSYLYFRPGQDPKRQARLLASVCADLDLCPQYDLEVDDGLGLAGREPTKTFIDTCDELIGAKGIIYTSAAWWANVTGNMPGYSDHLLWSARYPAGSKTPPSPASQWGPYAMKLNQPRIPEGWDRWDIWQWSAGGNNAGHTYGCASADLDLNIIRVDVADRLLLPHAQTTPGDTRPPPTGGTDVTADECRAIVAEEVRKALAEATGKGLTNWPDTVRADLEVSRQTFNAVTELTTLTWAVAADVVTLKNKQP